MSGSPAIHGYYINLDRAVARRENMEAQLAKFGLTSSYSRFPAVEGAALPHRTGPSMLTPGELGIFRSHMEVLRQAIASGGHVHVLEDDVIFSAAMKPVVDHSLKLGLFSIFDVVFLDFGFNIDFVWMRFLKGHAAAAFAKPREAVMPTDFRLVNVDLPYFLGMYSYIVNPDAAARILETFEAEWSRGPTMPVDHLLRREIRAGRLRAGCVVPFTTSVRLHDAVESQSGRADDLDFNFAQAMLRQSFFIDRDLVDLKRRADELTARTKAGKPPDQHYDLLLALMEYFAAR